MIRRNLLALSTLTLVACKSSAAGQSDAQCQKSCTHEATAVNAISKDIDSADLAASEIEKLEIKDDAQMKAAGERASARCADIRASLAHAPGIGWGLNDEGQVSSVELRNTLDALEGLERTAAPCVGRSPAQIKADLVAPVHALKTKAPKGDVFACTARCAPKH